MPVNIFNQATIFQRDAEVFQGFENEFVIDTTKGVSKIDENNSKFSAQMSKIINGCFQCENQFLSISLVQKGSLPKRNFVHYVDSDPATQSFDNIL